MAKKLGVVQTVIEGRRVTDDDTLELAKMIFRGKINTEILSQFRRRGIEAVGLPASTAASSRPSSVRQRTSSIDETGETETVDFGHVGDVVEIDASLDKYVARQRLLARHLVAWGRRRRTRYTTSTPTRSHPRSPASLGAEKLILLSDVNGIYLDEGDENTKISRLTDHGSPKH